VILRYLSAVSPRGNPGGSEENHPMPLTHLYTHSDRSLKETLTRGQAHLSRMFRCEPGPVPGTNTLTEDRSVPDSERTGHSGVLQLSQNRLSGSTGGSSPSGQKRNDHRK